MVASRSASVAAAGLILFPVWYTEALLMSSEVEEALRAKPAAVDKLRDSLRWQELPLPLVPRNLRDLDAADYTGAAAVATYCARQDRAGNRWRERVNWHGEPRSFDEIEEIWSVRGQISGGWTHNIFAGYADTYWVLVDKERRIVGWLKD